MSKTAANSKKTAKPRGKPWQPGQSGNPAGAPKRGESWAEIIKQYGDMTPEEAANRAASIAKQIKQIGNGVTLKEAVVLRVYAALLFDPNASLLNSFMERAEGKVTEKVDVTTDGEPIGKDDSDTRSEILRKLDSIAAATGAGAVSKPTDGK